MLEIREVTENTELSNLHEKMGLSYKLDLEQGDFIVRNGMYDNGRLVAAVLGRATTEAYLLLDRDWNEPACRWDAIKRVAIVSATEARDLYGIRDVHVWIPPKVSCFKRRLRSLGFVPTPWECLTARL
jgi:hypothetical protein